MSYPDYTKCCNLEFYGDSHNPVWDGKCHNCGMLYLDGVPIDQLEVEDESI